MDALVVQIAGRQGRVAELTRSRDGSLCVGRSYDNDLILTDQHVAPQQLAFTQVDDQWQMQVLDHTNPVLLNSKKVIGDSTPVSSGDLVTIGRTRLSLYSSETPVERTRKLVLSNWLALDNTGPIIPVLVLLAVCLFDLTLSYFEESIDLKWEPYAYGVLFSGVIIVSWAGLWAIAGRILRHQHHYGLQLIATTVVSLLASLLSLVGTYLAYPFHNVPVSDAVEWAVILVVLTALLHLNLLIATNIRRTLAVATALAALVTGVSFAFVLFGQDDEIYYIPEYSSTLLPPAFQVFEGQSMDGYFARVKDEVRDLGDNE
jgi:hypothetical protein